MRSRSSSACSSCDPADVGAKVNLGQVYVQQRNFADAITLLREALAAEPYNVTAAYSLATALTRAGAQDEGRQAMQRFQTLRDSTYGVTYAQTYLEQGSTPKRSRRPAPSRSWSIAAPPSDVRRCDRDDAAAARHRAAASAGSRRERHARRRRRRRRSRS